MEKQIERLKKLDYLIKTKSTGTPCDLAKKLNISERMVYEYINILKTEFNAPVKYNKSAQTYYYEKDGSLNLKWENSN